MAKLKNIIRQLSTKDYEGIYQSLIESSADKSAYLLQSMREKQVSDTKIMQELGVNTNAYYTLRSRLNQKIEEYLLEQMESPRTDILKKVANINEIMFTKKKTIAIATLKKLEKELIDYDLSNELTIVYKSLKKLHVNTPEQFEYSQLYNKHVAFTLAVDKAEDLLSEYFMKYGNYFLSANEHDQLGLSLLCDEMANVAKLYDSHRLFVYQSCMSVFHRLFVLEDDSQISAADTSEPIEDILKKVEDIFENYPNDSIYYHLKLVFDFLKLEYYTHYKVFRKAEGYFEEVNEEASRLLANYSQFTFPAQFLLTKIKRHNRLENEDTLYEENEGLFLDFEKDTNDLPKHITYVIYRSLSCYYAEKYDEGARWINHLLNHVSIKKYNTAHMEVKTILALQYALMRELDLFGQLISSVQRQIRLAGKENCEHIVIFVKILKTAVSEAKKEKQDKILTLIEKYRRTNVPSTSFLNYVKMDEIFIEHLVDKN
ncbi:MAG: hypothetical protein LAT68_03820 [Cyclobacteriaceae bacterium]|nr:hypothetical protein [Cyclobacteriaceae bacterium]MCH8515437.1 hypothetical protein [Cyclobacteriaceae bacterium]